MQNVGSSANITVCNITCFRALFTLREDTWALGSAKRGVSRFVHPTKYYSYNPIKEKETDGSCDPYGGEEKCIQSFDVGTCKKRRRGRYWHRWDNIIREIQRTEWGGMNWTELVGGSCEHGNESVDSINAGKLSSSWGNTGFSRGTKFLEEVSWLAG